MMWTLEGGLALVGKAEISGPGCACLVEQGGLCPLSLLVNKDNSQPVQTG